MHKKNILITLCGIYRSYWRRWATVEALSWVVLACGLSVPYLIKCTVDDGLVKKDLHAFLFWCAVVAGAVVTKVIFETLASIGRQALTAKVRFDLNRRIFKNMYHLPWGWFQAHSAGQVVYNLQADSAAVIEMPSVASGFVHEALQSAAALSFLLIFDVKIGLAAILFIPLLYVGSAWGVKKTQELCREASGNNEAVFNFLEESFWRAYLIKIFGAATAAVRRYSRLLLSEVRLTLKRERQEVIFATVPSFLPLLLAGVIYLFSGFQAIQGKISLGLLAAVGGYIYQFMASAGQLSGQWRNLQPSLVAIERLGPFLTFFPELSAGIGERLNGCAVSLERITFAYPGGANVLTDLSLNIAAGEYAVVNAPSGYGKSTLLNLLMGLYVPQQGAICFDDKNINILAVSVWGREIVLCPQEPMLWNATIAENITYPGFGYSKDEIKKAAVLSGADKFIDGLEKGYETVIGENATRLSQGQKQRLALSRAMIKCPKILLLDEAFSGLPEDEEALIIASLRNQFPGMTIISATHRLAALAGGIRIIKLRG